MLLAFYMTKLRVCYCYVGIAMWGFYYITPLCSTVWAIFIIFLVCNLYVFKPFNWVSKFKPFNQVSDAGKLLRAVVTRKLFIARTPNLAHLYETVSRRYSPNFTLPEQTVLLLSVLKIVIKPFNRLYQVLLAFYMTKLCAGMLLRDIFIKFLVCNLYIFKLFNRLYQVLLAFYMTKLCAGMLLRDMFIIFLVCNLYVFKRFNRLYQVLLAF